MHAGGRLVRLLAGPRPCALSLPVFTIADMNEFRTNNSYVERVVEALYDYLLRIDDVRGTGRLYLP